MRRRSFFLYISHLQICLVASTGSATKVFRSQSLSKRPAIRKFAGGINTTNMIELGIKGRQEEIVTEELTASHIGSGTVGVFATPMMIALMERTSRLSVKPYLEEGQETVGTKVNVSHVSSTPVGLKVWCESEVVEIDRRRIVFKVAAYDEKGLIGEGTHERFVIDVAKFKVKTEEKLR